MQWCEVPWLLPPSGSTSGTRARDPMGHPKVTVRGEQDPGRRGLHPLSTRTGTAGSGEWGNITEEREGTPSLAGKIPPLVWEANERGGRAGGGQTRSWGGPLSINPEPSEWRGRVLADRPGQASCTSGPGRPGAGFPRFPSKSGGRGRGSPGPRLSGRLPESRERKGAVRDSGRKDCRRPAQTGCQGASTWTLPT